MLSPEERAKKIALWFISTGTPDFTKAVSEIAAQICEAEEKAYHNGVQVGMDLGRESMREEAYDVAYDNGTNCCECATRIRALK